MRSTPARIAGTAQETGFAFAWRAAGPLAVFNDAGLLVAVKEKSSAGRGPGGGGGTVLSTGFNDSPQNGHADNCTGRFSPQNGQSLSVGFVVVIGVSSPRLS
jgi:hypothetical protein